MKELSIEEKAKAYDNALAHAKLLLKTIGNATLGNLVLKNEFEVMFPILKEDEDERIRKALIQLVNQCGEELLHPENARQMLAWLEKQGEQKLINPTLEEKDKMDDAFTKMMLKDEQKIAKWSEEDEKMLSDIIKDLVHPWNEYILPDRIEDEIKWLKNWLKSIRHLNRWKPSDEQMEALDDFIYAKYPNIEKYGAAVKSLYNDLKKLREE